MKKLFSTLLFAFMSMVAMAQSADSTIVMPSFRGGQETLMNFLRKNLKYPDLAEHYAVEGRVVMTFIVSRDGSLKDIAAEDCKIERFNTTKFSQETESKQKQLKQQFALVFAKEGARIIRKMPKWIPGTRNGEPIDVKFHLPIRFSIPDK